MEAKRPRAAKAVPSARCCWVCGRLGGWGFTSALRGLGYDIPPNGVVAHAHQQCIAREAKKLKNSRK